MELSHGGSGLVSRIGGENESMQQTPGLPKQTLLDWGPGGGAVGAGGGFQVRDTEVRMQSDSTSIKSDFIHMRQMTIKVI